MADEEWTIRWNPPVEQNKIRRLYEQEARGLCDETLVADVGLGLYLRCESILIATDALCGKAECLKCGAIIRHGCTKGETLTCSHCAWQFPWHRYRRRCEGMHGGGALPVYRAYMENYDRARDDRERLLLIDRLLHAFHWEIRGEGGRPAATSLIEGSMESVVLFLDTLTYGKGSLPERQATRARWHSHLTSAGENFPWMQRLLDEKRNRQRDGD